jgi:hypothetical protein
MDVTLGYFYGKSQTKSAYVIDNTLTPDQTDSTGDYVGNTNINTTPLSIGLSPFLGGEIFITKRLSIGAEVFNLFQIGLFSKQKTTTETVKQGTKKTITPEFKSLIGNVNLSNMMGGVLMGSFYF